MYTEILYDVADPVAAPRLWVGRIRVLECPHQGIPLCPRTASTGKLNVSTEEGPPLSPATSIQMRAFPH